MDFGQALGVVAVGIPAGDSVRRAGEAASQSMRDPKSKHWLCYRRLLGPPVVRKPLATDAFQVRFGPERHDRAQIEARITRSRARLECERKSSPLLGASVMFYRCIRLIA